MQHVHRPEEEMLCSNKEGSLSKTESSEGSYYNRKTPVSRSIKQNGEFLFLTTRRREPISPYVPPYRRKDSIGDTSLTSKRSGTKDRTSTPVNDVHARTKLQLNEDKFNGDSEEKNVIVQETSQERFAQRLNEESIAAVCKNESFRLSIKENDNRTSNEGSCGNKFNEHVTQDFNRSFRQKSNKENILKEQSQSSIVEKVLNLSQQYMSTEYKSILAEMYFNKYKEKLSTTLLSKIEFCIQINLDNTANETEHFNKQINEETRLLKDEKECRGENSLINHTELSQPKELNLSDIDKEFWVIIYNCESFSNIWGVIMDADHFGKVEDLTEQLKNYFQNESKLLNAKAEENSYYAVFDGSWYRVKCIKCNETTAEVFFIDRGDWDNIPITKLHKLDPKFFAIPAQAINMSLSDLEIFNNCDGAPKILDELLFEKVFYAVVKGSNEKKPYLSVQLHQTEDNDETINVNELLLKKLFETILDPLHNIPEDKPMHLEFMQINESGFFIQLNTTSLKYFKLLMEDLIEKYWSNENLEKQKIIRFESNKIYLVKSNRDKKFYRARVKKFTTEHTIEVLLIDSGIVIFINREDFFALEKLSPVLVEYPAQAIEIQLDQIAVLHPQILDHLYSLTSNSNQLYVKFSKIKLENNNAPIIRLYKKINGYLISVNDAILIEHNDILQRRPSTSESTPKSSKDNFGKFKLEPIIGNFCDNKSKFPEENVDKSQLKLAENNLTEKKQNSSEGNFGENKLKSSDGNFDENRLKSSKGNFGENKRTSTESSVTKENLNVNKLKSMENTFAEKKQLLSEENFSNNKKKPDESSFLKSKSTTDKQNQLMKQKPIGENNFIIEQMSPKNNYDELFKNNVWNDLDRFKQYEVELSRPVDLVDCSKMCLSGLINQPVLASKLFDVHVTVVKDPSCFAFQLLKSRCLELKRMEHEMKAVYRNYTGPKLTRRSIGVGQVYAYRCDVNSKTWYRVYLLKIKDENLVTVYYCDYGWYKDVNITNLVYLQRQFYALPYQALWAELHGVKPLSSQFWTTEVCAKFKELIESKSFVCKVKNSKNVKIMNRNKTMPVTVENIYVVKLIDTSTDEDIYIADILIEDGQALKKSSNQNIY